MHNIFLVFVIAGLFCQWGHAEENTDKCAVLKNRILAESAASTSSFADEARKAAKTSARLTAYHLALCPPLTIDEAATLFTALDR